MIIKGKQRHIYHRKVENFSAAIELLSKQQEVTFVKYKQQKLVQIH